VSDNLHFQGSDVIPTGWKIAPLRQVVSKLVDGSHTPPEKQERGRPMLSARNIENNQIVLDDFRYIDEKEFKREHARTRIAPGDVLLTIVGSIGRSAVVPDGFQDFTLQRSVAVLTPYLKTLGEAPIVVAPLVQQKQIVEEIEKQFSRLDEAVANLKRVKANLKRYKAAVLKAAVEGKLTEQWRKAHPDVEPASELLKRILAKRGAKWNRKGRYKEPIAPNTEILSPLPEGWVWARLDAIAALKGGITVDKNRKSATARVVPYLRVANVQRGFLDLSEIKDIAAPEAEIDELRLMPQDILFNEGGDRDKLGRGWIWEGQLPECIHQNHVFRARLYSLDVSPKLVSWWGNSFGQTYFLREGKQTTNLASVNLTKLSEFPVPLPASAEQKQIVLEVERQFSVIEEMETQVLADLQRADRFRQAILQRAFRGKLKSNGYGSVSKAGSISKRQKR